VKVRFIWKFGDNHPKREGVLLGWCRKSLFYAWSFNITRQMSLLANLTVASANRCSAPSQASAEVYTSLVSHWHVCRYVCSTAIIELDLRSYYHSSMSLHCLVETSRHCVSQGSDAFWGVVISVATGGAKGAVSPSLSALDAILRFAQIRWERLGSAIARGRHS